MGFLVSNVLTVISLTAIFVSGVRSQQGLQDIDLANYEDNHLAPSQVKPFKKGILKFATGELLYTRGKKSMNFVGDKRFKMTFLFFIARFTPHSLFVHHIQLFKRII